MFSNLCLPTEWWIVWLLCPAFPKSKWLGCKNQSQRRALYSCKQWWKYYGHVCRGRDLNKSCILFLASIISAVQILATICMFDSFVLKNLFSIFTCLQDVSSLIRRQTVIIEWHPKFLSKTLLFWMPHHRSHTHQLYGHSKVSHSRYRKPINLRALLRF